MIVVLFHLGIVVATTSTHRSCIPPETTDSDSLLFSQCESNTPRPSNKAVTSRSHPDTLPNVTPVCSTFTLTLELFGTSAHPSAPPPAYPVTNIGTPVVIRSPQC